MTKERSMLSANEPGTLFVSDSIDLVKLHMSNMGLGEAPNYPWIFCGYDLQDRIDPVALEKHLGSMSPGVYMIKPRKRQLSEIIQLFNRVSYGDVAAKAALEEEIRKAFITSFGRLFLIKNFDTIIVAFDNEQPYYLWQGKPIEERYPHSMPTA